MKPSPEEINRKLLHLVALIIPAGIYYLPLLTGLPAWVPPVILGILLLISLSIEVLRQNFPGFQKKYKRLFGKMLREAENKQVTGATYIIAGSFVCAVIFIHAPHISFITLTLFILGDAVASLAGMRFGRFKVLNKTIEGSLACFSLCLILSTILFPRLPSLSTHFSDNHSVILMVIMSLAITLLELFPIKIAGKLPLNDNLYVPPVAGLLLIALQEFIQ